MIKHYHKFQWFYLTFLLFVFIGLGGYYTVHLGYYPVAVVNSSIITAHSLNEEYAAAYQYYSRTLANQKNVDVKAKDFKKELRRAALGDLIEKTLIYQELKARVGGEVNNLVESKINQEIGNRQNLEEAAKLLYGLTLAEFKELVLVPQAQKEILEGRLFLEKKNLDEWLENAKAQARVFILTPEFFWDKNKIRLR